MKHLIIGDLHGRDWWKKADMASAGRVVFLGDYTDSFKRSDEVIFRNLQEIIAVKKRFPEKVILLLGNHDVQYLHYPRYYCPGFRPSMQPVLTRLFQENESFFQIAYQRRNFLFTHAGITNRWFQKFIKSPIYELFHLQGEPIARTLNQIAENTQDSPIYAYSRYKTGHDSDGGPLWADKIETWNDALNGYHQFVGHTPQDQPTACVSRGKSITYLDVLHKQTYFHEIHC